MKRGLLLFVMAFWVAGCISVQVNQSVLGSPSAMHVVVCWLKNPGNADERAALIRESKGLGEIPGVLHVSAGTVLPSTRPAVDSSFDVAIVMTFKDEASLAEYASHPKHLAAVERTLKPLVAKYVVYDYLAK